MAEGVTVSAAGADHLEIDVVAGGDSVHTHVWRPTIDDASAPATVLLACHGLTDSGRAYGTLWEDLAGRWPIVAPDAPGHGGTAWRPAATYRIEDHVAGVCAVLDELPRVFVDAGQVVVMGHSMGALTAARVAAARPATVRRLVIEEPPRKPRLPWWDRYKHRAWMTRLQGTDEAGRIEALTELTQWRAGDLAAWAASKPEVDTRIFDVPTVWGPSLVRELERAECPVTLVLGDATGGSTTDAATIDRLRAACRAGLDVVRLRAGHNPRREAPEDFTECIRAALLSD